MRRCLGSLRLLFLLGLFVLDGNRARREFELEITEGGPSLGCGQMLPYITGDFGGFGVCMLSLSPGLVL